MNLPLGYSAKISLILIMIKIVSGQLCTSIGHQRCVCNSRTPNCACQSLTASNTLNFSSSYNSHLISVQGQGCLPCPSNCLKCTSETKCITCFSSFQLSSSNQCFGCPINCQTCSNGICTLCNSGFYLDNQVNCQSCPVIGSLVCTMNSLVSCRSNFWLDNNAANCVSCDPNCQQCLSTSKCKTCNVGYFVQNNHTCKKCLPQCLSCNSQASCVLCLNSSLYFNTLTSKCIQSLVQNCLIPLNSTQCLQCVQGHYLNGSSCKLITFEIQLCQDYNFYNNKVTCRNCTPGYFNSTSQNCQFGCSNLCTSCFGPHYGLCYVCISTAYLYNMHCIPIYNLEAGSSYQLFYTASNNPSFFTGTLTDPKNCIFESLIIGNQVSFTLKDLQSYQIQIIWKIYLMKPYKNFKQTSYNLTFGNQNSNLTYQYNCSHRVSNCQVQNQACVSKDYIKISSLIKNQNDVSFSAGNSTQIGISQVLIVSYRCGGTNGQQCLLCSSINECTKCKNPNYFILGSTCISECPANYFVRLKNKQCKISCPPQTYTILANQSCSQCLQPCLACTASTSCLSCANNWFLFSQKCVQQCPDFYYGNTIKKTCQKCIRPCLKCQSNSKCLSCIYGFHQSQTNRCVPKCPKGYYGSFQFLNCQKCSFPCATCRPYQAFKCQTCLQSYFLNNQQCLNKCPHGFFSSQSSCQPCNSMCLSCQVSSVNCTSCPIGTYWIDYLCSLDCPDGFYQDRVNNLCQKCAQECASCLNKYQCHSCNQGYNYFSQTSQCLSNCPSEYYEFVNICKRCHSPCRACLSQTKCMSCQSLFIYNNTCLSSCPHGTFQDTSLMSCQKCNSSLCSQCDASANFCILCNSPKILFDNQCLDQCSKGYYIQATINQCVRCKENCNICSSQTFCHLCQTGYGSYQGNCLKQCVFSTYKSIENQIQLCIKCPQRCQTCVYKDWIFCTACKTGFYLHLSQCIENCPSGYFLFDSTCHKCKTPCQSCSVQFTCLSCQISLGFLLGGNCLNQCPIQYFQNNTVAVCQRCAQGCLACKDSAENCLSCRSNLYLQNNRCLSNCMQNYYSPLNSYSCHRCHFSCRSCKHKPQNCIQCSKQSLVLVQGKCLEQCKIGFYKSSNSCVQCSSSCSRCLNHKNCTKCDQKFYLTSTLQCQEQCPSSYFAINGLCKKCKYPCRKCSSESSCLSCLRGYLNQGRCLQQCTSPMFLNQPTLVCDRCEQNCMKCNDLKNCQSCSKGYLMKGLCVQNCSLSYYPYYSICVPCMYGCLHCRNASYCIECFIGYLYNGICLQFCPEGWTASQMNNPVKVCLKCSQNCQKCAVKPNQCTSCLNGYFLYISSCVYICPAGSYKDYERAVCLSCKHPCKTCDNGYSCKTCIFGYIIYSQKSGNQCIQGPRCPNSFYLDVFNNTCVYQCPSNTFVEPINYVCQKRCKDNYVLLQKNNLCLEECSSNMWVDHNLICRQHPSHIPLPFFSCKPLIIRNILIVQCIFSVPIENINLLNQQSFYFDQHLKVHRLNIISNNKIKMILNSDSRDYHKSEITIHLKQRYILYSKISASHSNQPNRLLYSNLNIPVQNIRNTFVLDQYFAYSSEQRLTGMHLKQLASSVAIGAFLFWFLSILKNGQPYSLCFILFLQWLYCLSILDNNFPPNLQQFIQGFSIANLFGIQESRFDENDWINQAQRHQKLWGVINVFNFKNVFLPSLITMSIFLSLYILTKILSIIFQKEQKLNLQRQVKREEQEDSKKTQQSIFVNKVYSDQKNTQNQTFKQIREGSVQINSRLVQINENKQLNDLQNKKRWLQIKQKLGHKFRIINLRFYYNYPFNIILLTISPISIGIICQLIQPNKLSLSLSILFILSYFFIAVLVLNHYKQKGKIKKSTKYSILMCTQIGINSIFCIFSTLQFYIGTMMLIFIINIFLWHKYLSQSRQHQGINNYQLVQIIKIVLLIQIIIAYVNKSKWDGQIYYNYAWLIIVTSIVIIILLAVQVNRQFFKRSTDRYQDNISQFKTQGDKDSQFDSFNMIKSQKKDLNIALKPKEKQQVQEQIQQDFFSNHRDDAVENQTDQDIIDFLYRQESVAKPPQTLIKYLKTK